VSDAVVDRYLDAARRWPEVFEAKRHRAYLAYSRQQVDQVGDPGSRASQLGRYLKAALLKQLRRAASQCEACPLHNGRIGARTLLEDGDPENDLFHPHDRWGPHPAPIGPLEADLLLVSSHGGEWEQRSGQPFTSLTVLQGSVCGQRCGNYERCFPVGCRTPQAPCEPRALTGEEQKLRPSLRLAEPLWPMAEPSMILDRCLFRAGEWRESWNPRQRLGTGESPGPRPGTVYLTYLVKCPSEERAATEAEVAACQQFLEIQLYTVQPTAIVALGKQAAAVCQAIADCPVVAAQHPHWISHQPREQQREEMKRLTGQIRTARQQSAPVPVVAAAIPSPREASFIPTFPDEAAREAAERGNRE
jgi:uracil-DNA glycosylase